MGTWYELIKAHPKLRIKLYHAVFLLGNFQVPFDVLEQLVSYESAEQLIAELTTGVPAGAGPVEVPPCSSADAAAGDEGDAAGAARGGKRRKN